MKLNINRLSFLLAIALSIFLWVGTAYAASATLYLAPAQANADPNSTLTVNVREDSGSDSVNIVKTTISYPADKLSVSSVTPAPAFNFVFQNSYGNGSIQLTLGASPAVNQDQLVATISFQVIGSGGTAPVSFSSDSTVVSSGTNILTAANGGTYTITSTAPIQPTSPSTNTTTHQTTLKISKVSVSQPVSISWVTSVPATSEVDYGLDNKYGKQAQDNSYVTKHSMVLTPASLAPGSTYHFRVKSVDRNGNVAVSQDATFITPANQSTPPGSNNRPVLKFQTDNQSALALIAFSSIGIGALFIALWRLSLKKGLRRVVSGIFFNFFTVSTLSRGPIKKLILHLWKSK